MKIYKVKLTIFEALDKQHECLVEVPDDFEHDDKDTSITTMVYYSADLDEDFVVCKANWSLVEEHAEEVLAPTEEDKKLPRWRLRPGFDKADVEALERVEENL